MRKILISKNFSNLNFSSIFLNFKPNNFYTRKFFTTNFSNFPLKENLAFKNLKIPTVTIVRDKEHALSCVEILKKHKDRFHAWDTETLEIDPKEESPVLKGKIICMSCFIGPDIDFGNGPSILNSLKIIHRIIHR